MNERSILNELDTDNIQPKIKFLKQTIYSYIFKTNKRFQLNFLITSKSLKAEPSSNSSSEQIKDSNLNHISKLSDFLHYIQAKSSADVTWEQVLDASGQANIQHAATKVTSADDFTFTLRLFVSVSPTESNQSSNSKSFTCLTTSITVPSLDSIIPTILSPNCTGSGSPAIA